MTKLKPEKGSLSPPSWLMSSCPFLHHSQSPFLTSGFNAHVPVYTHTPTNTSRTRTDTRGGTCGLVFLEFGSPRLIWFPGSSTFLQMSWVRCLQTSIIRIILVCTLYVHTIFSRSNHQLMDTQAASTSLQQSTRMWKYLCDRISLGKCLGVVQSRCQTDCHNSYINLHSHHLWVRVPLSHIRFLTSSD